MTGVDPRQQLQERNLAEGKAAMLDTSAISHATEKEAMDASFQSSATQMSNVSAASNKEAILRAQANQRARLEQLNQSLNQSMSKEEKKKE
jgi:hypothetical protein